MPRSHYSIVPGVPEITIERPDILEHFPSSSEATSKESRLYLSSTPFHGKPKIATLPEEPRLLSYAGSPSTTLLTPIVTTPSTVLWTSPSSIEPLTPTWYITSPPPTPLTVHTPTEPIINVNKQYLSYTTKPYETNKPTLLTRQPDKEHLVTHLALEKPKQLERTTATTQPTLLYSTIPAVRGHRSVKPAAVRPALQEMEKELTDLLRVQIPLLLTDDIAEALNMCEFSK